MLGGRCGRRVVPRVTTEDLTRASTEHARDASPDQFDVAVVGGGQAGLAIGYWLAKQGGRFVILEAGDSVATAWRKRWDSLVLFTSRRYDALPGLAFPGDPHGYPTRGEVIAYLERYASEFNLPVQTNSRVRSLTIQGGRFLLDLGERRIQAKQVVVATGPFQAARTPAWAGSLAPDVFRIHSSDYRRPSEIPAGTVLVVGGGNTGYQIAKELTATHEVHLAVGSRQTPLPQRLLGHRQRGAELEAVFEIGLEGVRHRLEGYVAEAVNLDRHGQALSAAACSCDLGP